MLYFIFHFLHHVGALGIAATYAIEAATLVALLRLVGERGTQIERLQTHAPTLEDVFLKLTGRGLRD